MLIAENFSANATKNAGKPALRYLGKETTFAQLKESIGRLSYLYQHELGKEAHGARVAFFARNSPAYIKTFFALTNIRAITIPIDPELPPEEIIEWLKDAGATHVAVTSDLLGKVREILQAGHLTLPIIEIEKKQGGEYDTSFSPPPESKPLEQDVILLIRTAGTTGKHKYITMTHKQIHHAAVSLRGLYRIMPTDRMLSILPWSLPFSFVHHMLFPLLLGATCVIDHGLQNVEFLDFLLDSHVTRMIGTPAFFLKLLITCKNEKRMLPGVKGITVGLGPLIPEVKRTFDLLKINVSHTHGQAENVWTIAMEEFPSADKQPASKDEKPEYKLGYVGKGLPGLKYKVIDSNGDEIPGKEKRKGLLCVSGPTIMQSYLDQEKETKQKIRGTWLYTWDYAELEGEGDDLKITFLGRRDDYLESDGVPVSFSQIDKTLRKIRGVQDAAAFLMPKTTTVKKESAIVCAAVRVQGSPLNEKAILDACAAELPSHMVPIAVAFTDQIPRDAGGNINSSRLRGQFSGLAG